MLICEYLIVNKDNIIVFYFVDLCLGFPMTLTALDKIRTTKQENNFGVACEKAISYNITHLTVRRMLQLLAFCFSHKTYSLVNFLQLH
jgi:hypothetical protein